MNTTAPMLRTPHRPVRHSFTTHFDGRRLAHRARAALRSMRYDDRPEIEHHLSPSGETIRPYQHLATRA